MDTLTRGERSARMALVRQKDTKPELVVRRLAHVLGYRYRLHRRDLPGTPDLVFPGRGKIIRVHGCFWHCHVGCSLARLPKSRLDFWLPKLTGNVERDARSLVALRRLGWGVMTVWECQTRDTARLANRIRRFLDEKR
jgi:DNA mismatch endonuclease (patch repair protein)